MKKFLSKWRAWISMRPIAAILLAFLYGISIGVVGALELGEIAFWMVAAVVLLIIAAFYLVDRKWLATALCVVITATCPFGRDATAQGLTDAPHSPPDLLTPYFPPPPGEGQQPNIRAAGAIAIGIGAGVIIGCGYICYRVIDTCAKNKKKLPPPPPPRNTNDNSDLTLAGAFGDNGGQCDDYAVSYYWQADYCSIEAGNLVGSEAGTAFHGVTLTLTVSYGGVPECSIQHHSDSELVDFNADREAMSRDYGINWNGHGGDYQTTKNGVPVDRSLVPASVTTGSAMPTVVIYPDRPQHKLAIDVSTDGETYGRLANISIPSGEKLIVQDARESSMAFYRVTVEE